MEHNRKEIFGPTDVELDSPNPALQAAIKGGQSIFKNLSVIMMASVSYYLRETQVLE
jgi:hypothetical protein